MPAPIEAGDLGDEIEEHDAGDRGRDAASPTAAARSAAATYKPATMPATVGHPQDDGQSDVCW